ncbi:MAG: DoxX family protein [Saprospiraceae bacterium]|jgi:putative oxidoreductase|nr:DoxX family protein [Saprospiraceae bacterium]
MTQSESNSKVWHVSLWVLQVALAGMFGMAGFMKATAPLEELAKNMAWVNETGGVMVRFIGISEILGAVGLIFPSLLRIQPRLTSFAAMGLFVIMLLAMMFHVMRQEMNLVPVNVILAAACIFIAWGRFVKAPISAN